jgi:hypothetical protein
MIVASERASFSPLVLALSALLVPILAAFVVVRMPVSSTTLLVGGVLLLLIGLLHIKLTIYLIIFSMLLSPELGIGATAGDRPVTIRFEDILLILVGVAWLARSAYQKDLGLIRSSPLNGPIAAYSAAAIAATLVNGWLDEINWLPIRETVPTFETTSLPLSLPAQSLPSSEYRRSRVAAGYRRPSRVKSASRTRSEGISSS